MSDYQPRNQGPTFSKTASAAITGGQIVEVTGADTVGPAGAGSAKVIGVAAFDAASGQRVTIHRRTAEHNTLIKSASVLAAGSPIKTGANGQVDLFVSGTDAPTLLLGFATVGGTGDGSTVYASWVGI